MNIDDDRVTQDSVVTKETRGFGRSLLLALAPVMLLAGAFFVAPAAVQGAAGGGFWGHRHGGGDPAEARARLERGTDWILAVVDGSDAQREEILAVVGRAADVLEPIAERHRQNREAWLAAFSAARIDRAELERLRSEELALAEEASGHLVAALADASDVLSPEQRTKLASLAQRFHRDAR